jgi:hypothetical protein
MVDVIKKILDVSLAIKEAIQTARTHKRECKAIKKVADRVCGLVPIC